MQICVQHRENTRQPQHVHVEQSGNKKEISTTNSKTPQVATTKERSATCDHFLITLIMHELRRKSIMSILYESDTAILFINLSQKDVSKLLLSLVITIQPLAGALAASSLRLKMM